MKKYNYPVIDYAKRRDQRHVLTNYLRTGPFQQISGRVLQGRRIYRRRTILCVIAFLLLFVGLYGVIFG